MKKYLFWLLAVFMNFEIFPQNLLMQDFPKQNISLNFRFLRPDFESHEVNAFSGIYDFKMNLPISRKFDIVTSLPLVAYTRKNVRTYYYGSDGNALGNWFLGIQSKPDYEKKTFYNVLLGVYLPTSSNSDYSPLGFAFFTDFHQSYRYTPDLLTIYFNYERLYLFEDGITAEWEFGPQIHIPTNQNSSNGQLNFHYGVNGSAKYAGFFGTAEIVGTFSLASSIDNLEDRFFSFFDIGFGFNGPNVSPTLFYQLPIDKRNRSYLVNSMFGFKLMVQLH